VLEQCFAPLAGVGELILRLTIALAFWPHGREKLKGPAGFGGFLAKLGVPAPVVTAWMVALLESVGAGFLVLGLATRLVALGLVVDMFVAIVAVRIGRAKAPFASTPQVQGWEFEFVLMGAAIALFFIGAGRFSIDALLGL